MAKYVIDIDFRKYTSHPQLVDDISPAFVATQGDEVEITIHLITYYRFLYSDFLLLVVAAIQQLKAKGVQITGRVYADSNDDKVKYASRVNFFQQLGLDFPEDFVRYSGTGKFTEISSFDKDSIYALQDELTAILHKSGGINVEVLQMLYWCLNEIMDNVLIHSQLPTGWVSGQFFPKQKEIRMIICDTGLGIHNALTTYPGTKYGNITEQEALQLCIQNRVTSGAGMRFGLFDSSEFIKENAGELLIYSGNHYLENKEKEFVVTKGNFWHGTFVFLRINTDIPVDYKQILPAHHSLPDDYQEFIEKMFGIDENLW